uniref:NmrA-like domain-containing protein n=1 Tax=Lotus japonicus TaxID=34305 RepID=I3SAJ5_LOTJA|nr:unknown [Lotus japonicus]
MEKSKVLVVGGTGYIGRRIVKASLEQGHETYVLQRPELGLQIEKLQMLLSFKKQGAHLVKASFSDHKSLVDAVKKVDVVISAISGVHIRTHCISLQLKLIDAIKEAGNVKRFLPSEFGLDSARMGHALEPGRVAFDDKMAIRKAIEEANIPFTYISANLFAGYFAGSLSQMGSFVPPREKVHLFGDGTQKAVFMDEDDVATYTIKTIDDPRTLNKTLYMRPPQNVLSQGELIGIWEKLIGKELEKTYIPAEEFLTILKGLDYKLQVAMGHFLHIFYEGCITNFEIGDDGEEASKLYPEVNYTRMDEYLKIYV